MNPCVDQVVGDILSGWRYDISGLAPEMRGDYERHFADCPHCRSRRRLHRTIDFVLIAMALISAAVFLLAFGAVMHYEPIRHFSPKRLLIMEIMALGGFLLSSLLAIVVAVATPAPVVMAHAARTGAKRLGERLPPEIRDRLPEAVEKFRRG